MTAALLLAASAALAQASSPASPAVPPAPAHHFNDYAAFVPTDDAGRLDQRLAAVEAETQHQFVVVVFPSLPAPSLEDFTLEAANAWGVGRKGADDGVVLFVFVKEHRLRLEVGRGLETVLTDEICRRIIDERITPAFRRGDVVGGLYAGIEAVRALLRPVN